MWTVLGWIFVPYIMVVRRWKQLAQPWRIVGGVWAAFALVTMIHAITAPHPTNITATQATPTVTTTAASSTASKTTPTASTNSAPSAIPATTPGTIGTWQITVNSVQETPRVGDAIMGSTANGIYWVVSVTVKNIGTSPATIDDSMFAITGGGATYNASSSADIDANSNDAFFLQQVNPGVTVSGVLVFDMPRSIPATQISRYRLYVDPGLFQSKQDFALP